MRIKQLRQTRSDLTAKMTAIRDLCAKETRARTEAERTEFTALETQYDANEVELAAEERLIERERRLQPVVDAEQQTTARAEATASIQVGRDRAEADPKRGFTSHVDYFGAVMAWGSGRRQDARLRPLQATQGSDEQGNYSDPYGGFLVPSSILPGVLTMSVEDDPIAPLVTPVPMRTPSVTINARVDKDHSTSVSGGLTVTRRPETVDGTSSRTKFEQIQLNAHELFGLAFATESILVDSPESFIAILNAGFRDEFAGNALNERLNGTGVGEFLGVMNSAALLTVSKKTGQAAATVVTENIDDMSARCWRFRRAVWLANQTTKPQLMALVRAVGTGGAPVPYYRPAEGETGTDTLLGRPIYFSEYAKALGTKGDLLLGVWSQYLEAEYQPLQQAESMHVRFLANERAFKFWKRNDATPWWKTVLTPRNGDTLSAFVTLATRA